MINGFGNQNIYFYLKKIDSILSNLENYTLVYLSDTCCIRVKYKPTVLNLLYILARLLANILLACLPYFKKGQDKCPCGTNVSSLQSYYFPYLGFVNSRINIWLTYRLYQIFLHILIWYLELLA